MGFANKVDSGAKIALRLANSTAIPLSNHKLPTSLRRRLHTVSLSMVVALDPCPPKVGLILPTLQTQCLHIRQITNPQWVDPAPEAVIGTRLKEDLEVPE